MENNTQAQLEEDRIVKLLFDNPRKDVLSRDELQGKIAMKTYYNYGPILYKAGYAKAKKQGLKLVEIRLTEKGKAARDGSVHQPAASSIPAAKQAEITELELLDRSTEVTDEFNRRSNKWEWVMKRKGEPISR